MKPTPYENCAGQILHLDDERAVREAIALLLRTEGYAVHSAASPGEAVALARQGMDPDVLIVDFHLDEQMNGAEVAEQIRRILPHTPPIIILTGDLTAVVVPRNTDAPVWLTRKPMDPQRLLAALPGLIQVSRATRALAA